MAVYGARSAEWYRATYSDASISGVILATDAGKAGIIVAKSAKYTIFIQKVTLVVTTLGAQTHTFQDTASTPIKAGVLEASAAAGVVRIWDFGARGFALTEAKNLDISGSAAPAYSYIVEGYQKLTSADQATTVDRTF